MSLAKCRDCGTEVSRSAKSCPKCGRAFKHTSAATWGCLLLILASVIGILATRGGGGSGSSPAKSAQPTAAQTGIPSGRIADAGMSEEEKKKFLRTRAGKCWEKHHGEWSPDDCKTVVAGKIRIGMTPEMVRAALGAPERRNTSTYASGKTEQWVYGIGQYVHFRDGVVSSISQSHE